MGKILEFRPGRHADMEKLLREFFARERELDREVDPEIVRRAEALGYGTVLVQADVSPDSKPSVKISSPPYNDCM